MHGSTQSAAGWNPLVAELARRGHDAITPTLPADAPEASATVYADEIVRSLPDDASNTVVVAHSASGLFLPLVPARRQVGHIVFLAAVIPKIGVSLADQFRSEPDMLNPEWIGKDPTASDEIAMRFLFHDCTPEVAQWALTTRRLMHALRAYTEVCPLTHWPDVPASSIVCSDDRTVRTAWSKAAARERLGVEPIELRGGHCPHVSRPLALADALLSIVDRSANDAIIRRARRK
ncbi:MAG TPA: alpha/beta hydrolase [Vicinamibacterales bacterium]|nr:alpha/beta hydrolase [Vicinamibacterales bacterium]